MASVLIDEAVSAIPFVGEQVYYWYVDRKGKLINCDQKNQPVPLEIMELYVGELNAIDLHKVCFEKERYKRITISDIEASTELLNILQGEAVEPRKQYIYENAKELGFTYD